MAVNRKILFTLTAATLAVCVAVSLWLVFHADSTDCQIVDEMASYSAAENKRLMSDALASGDQHKTVTAYEEFAGAMHRYANRISAPDLRSKAESIAQLDSGIIEEWKRILQRPPAAGNDVGMAQNGREFATTYSAYATERAGTMRELQSACSEGA